MGRILLGDPLVPGNPTFGGIRPGPKTVILDIEIYGLTDEWDAIGLLGNKAARRIEGSGTKIEGLRKRGVRDQEVRSLKHASKQRQYRNEAKSGEESENNHLGARGKQCYLQAEYRGLLGRRSGHG